MVQFTLSFDNVSVAAADEEERRKEGFRGGANNNIVIKRGVDSLHLFIYLFTSLIS